MRVCGRQPYLSKLKDKTLRETVPYGVAMLHDGLLPVNPHTHILTPPPPPPPLVRDGED